MINFIPLVLNSPFVALYRAISKEHGRRGSIPSYDYDQTKKPLFLNSGQFLVKRP